MFFGKSYYILRPMCYNGTPYSYMYVYIYIYKFIASNILEIKN